MTYLKKAPGKVRARTVGGRVDSMYGNGSFLPGDTWRSKFEDQCALIYHDVMTKSDLVYD